MTKARVLAGILDWLLVALWCILCALEGVVGYLMLDERRDHFTLIFLCCTALAVIPSVLALSVLEGGAKQASFGKRVAKIVVGDKHGHRISFGKALLRNIFKVGLPILFIALAILVCFGPFSWETWLVIAVAGVLPLVYLIGLFVPGWATLYDAALETQVLPRLRFGRRAIVPDDYEDDDDDEGDETIILPRRALAPVSEEKLANGENVAGSVGRRSFPD
ncbi:MAG: RDD family protein [Propionibacteriaceae bacterium]|jgi:uncharacterized RDD family membrane protein YckC|nr:RDD family protein [Propionibacteriaceae bacterium]